MTLERVAMGIDATVLGDGTPCTCKRCGLDLTSEMDEWQERLEIHYRAGYGSIFGDENVVSTTLCQRCVKAVLGEWLDVQQDNDGHRVKVEPPKGAYQPYQLPKGEI